MTMPDGLVAAAPDRRTSWRSRRCWRRYLMDVVIEGALMRETITRRFADRHVAGWESAER